MAKRAVREVGSSDNKGRIGNGAAFSMSYISGEDRGVTCVTWMTHPELLEKAVLRWIKLPFLILVDHSKPSVGSPVRNADKFTVL